MRGRYFLTIVLPSLLLLRAFRGRSHDLPADRHERAYDLTNRHPHGISLPITRSVDTSNHRKRRRAASTNAIGLGDYLDVYVSFITIPVLEELTCISPGCTAF